jgi:glycosyltransferase involved in cell wall biosynthesis
LKNVLGFALYGSLAASTRYRLLQYIDGLRQYGIKLEVQSLLSDEYLRRSFRREPLPWLNMLGSGLRRLGALLLQRRYDAVMVHCELFRMMPEGIESSLLRIPYLYDFDDAFYLKYCSGRMGAFKQMLGDKFDHVIGSAAGVTAGSRTLHNYALRFNSKSKLLPTVVNTARYVPRPKIRSRTLTVGWIGSPTTAPDLGLVAKPLNQLAGEGPVRVVVIGGKAPSIPNAEVIEMEWREDNEVETINTFDVGVMPLPDSEWSRGKCAFKLIQYMACAVPVVASPVGANVDVIQGPCGMLARTEEDWLNALRYLRDRPSERADMGSYGRQRIEEHFSLRCNLPLLADSLLSVLAKH